MFSGTQLGEFRESSGPASCPRGSSWCQKPCWGQRRPLREQWEPGGLSGVRSERPCTPEAPPPRPRRSWTCSGSQGWGRLTLRQPQGSPFPAHVAHSTDRALPWSCATSDKNPYCVRAKGVVATGCPPVSPPRGLQGPRLEGSDMYRCHAGEFCGFYSGFLVVVKCPENLPSSPSFGAGGSGLLIVPLSSPHPCSFPLEKLKLRPHEALSRLPQHPLLAVCVTWTLLEGLRPRGTCRLCLSVTGSFPRAQGPPGSAAV